MTIRWTTLGNLGKQTIKASLLSSVLLVAACSVNPATGDRQFTALMPTTSEASLGAEEHAKIAATYGGFMTGSVADYVKRVGQKVATNTERADVQYQFFVIDSPMVNAFALPGGYVYISRGLLALANSEAELGAVLGHEIGHVTARHAAERMSQGFVVGLGAAVLGAAAGSDTVTQAANVGSELYLKSYSRGQEHQADELGVRYVSRAGYDPMAMASFLRSLDAQSKLEQKESGQSASFNYFSTHPITAERVSQATTQATQYSPNSTNNRAAYLTAINGLTYGDSESQGFIRGNKFYHTQIGFMFEVPTGSKMINGAAQVAANHPNGTVILLDTAKDANRADPLTYLSQIWLRGENPGNNAESININGMRAATASFTGNVQGKAVTVRLVAIEWAPGVYYRFQMAIPQTVPASFIEELKRATYSFRKITEAEKNMIHAKKIRVLEASAGATVLSMSAKMDIDGDKKEQFLVLNGMNASDRVVVGQPYKIVME